MYIEGMSSHVRTYINISTGLLITSYINQVSTNKNADDRQHGNRYPGCRKIGLELLSKGEVLMTKRPAVGIIFFFRTERVTKTTTKKQFKDTYGFCRHTVSTYDSHFELSPCSKHSTDVSIPLNELRLRSKIAHMINLIIIL